MAKPLLQLIFVLRLWNISASFYTEPQFVPQTEVQREYLCFGKKIMFDSGAKEGLFH